MNKKFYLTPEMEETDLKIETILQVVSNGAGDPVISDEYGEGDPDD